MDIDQVIQKIGAVTREAMMVAEADLSDGAVMYIKWANPAFTRLLGYTSEDLEGNTAGILAGKLSSPATHADIIEQLQAWASFASEMYIYRKDGSPFWGQLSFHPVADDDGVYRYWLSTVRDHTLNKQRADALGQMSLIARATSDMVSILDPERRVTWINPSFEGELGYSNEDAAGKRLDALIGTPDSPMALPVRTARAGAYEKPVFGEFIGRRIDDTRFLGEYEVQPIYGENDRLEKYVAITRDVTQRKTLENRYKSVFDNANAAISIKDNRRYVLVNSKFAELCGVPAGDLMGSEAPDILKSDADVEELRTVEAFVLSSGSPIIWERSGRLSDGPPQHFLTKTFRLHDPVLDQYQICSVATDITHVRETEAKLRQSQQELAAAQDRLWGALDAIPEGFVIYDHDDRITTFNKAFRDVHEGIEDLVQPGTTYTELIDAGLENGIWDTGRLSRKAWRKRALASRRRASTRGREVRRNTGRWLLVKDIVLPNGERAGLQIDITEAKDRELALKRAQRTAHTAEARLRAAISALDESFVIYDSEDRLAVQNDKSRGLVLKNFPLVEEGMTFEEILRHGIDEGVFVDAKGREEEWLAERLAAHRAGSSDFEQKFSDGRIFRIAERRTEQGDTVSLRTDITQTRLHQEQLQTYAEELRLARDVLSERNAALEEAQAELEHASLHDALTELPNRRYLDRVLRKRSDAARNGQTGLAALHIDLDRFKQINDAFGHDAGDHVLSVVADILREHTREGDFAARVGGDEFVVLSTVEDGDNAALGRFAGRLLEQLRKPVKYGPHECRYGGSIGIALSTDADHDPKKLLINADIALYRAKTSGRNKWAFFSESLQQEVLEEKELADDILRGLDREEFGTLYQAQFNLADMSLAGAEVLLRWDHPEKGQLEPSHFVRIAEDLNVLRQIDQIVLQQAMYDDARWRAEGLEVPGLAVNVSGLRLRDPDLIEDIKRGGIEPGRLSVELLEAIFLDDEDEVMAWNLDQLREMGVSIELDDFGTGHSSIIGLVKLKPNRIKIDRQFVEQMNISDGNRALLSSIVNIGRSLDVEILAEGITSAKMASDLYQLGCTIGQGYALAPPMTADEFQQLLIKLLPKAVSV